MKRKKAIKILKGFTDIYNTRKNVHLSGNIERICAFRKRLTDKNQRGENA
jgi:hypothetical protein